MQIVPSQTSLVNPTEEYFKALVTYLDEKLTAGSGETLFQIGVGGEHLYPCPLHFFRENHK